MTGPHRTDAPCPPRRAARFVVGARAMLTAALVAGLVTPLGSACDPKVPIVDIGAAFSVADATWFEDEHTLFVFWHVEALQGLSSHSRIELRFVTDDAVQDFASITDFEMVHLHAPVSCGEHALCGSASIRVDKEPRDVALQLRYHEDGALTLAAPLAMHVVRAGPAATNRSAILYGVFDEDNAHVQWRLRHQFPAVRNEEAEALGLHRTWSIDQARIGTWPGLEVLASSDNPYGYGLALQCSDTFTPLPFAARTSTDRAFFADETIDPVLAPEHHVCAIGTVSDAVGTFSTSVLAQRNPQVAPAFPELQTPVREVSQQRYLLQTCNAIASERHRQMQMQRLFLSELDVVCIDDATTAGFATRLARRLQDRIDATRSEGSDVLFVIGLQRPDGTDEIARAVEDALDRVLTAEGSKSSPRLVGAFVFDSAFHATSFPEVDRRVLWCPSNLGGTDLDLLDDIALRTCALQANTDIQLGRFRFAQLPILPTRAQYETFVDRYNEDLAGQMRALTFRAPTRTPLSTDVPLGDFGVATFFNNEAITPASTDALSFCGDNDSGLIVWRNERDVASGTSPRTLAELPDAYAAEPAARYALGIAWDFPFLAHLEYETSISGGVTVVGFTVPFGPSTPAEQYLGAAAWDNDSFVIGDALLQCTRFCDAPTFDSAGIYNVRQAFRVNYRNQCYRPIYPKIGDGGSPLDP